MIIGLVQSQIKNVILGLTTQYVSKNIKVIENKVTDKIENKIDLHYKVMYEEQLKRNEEQLKTSQQMMTLMKFILMMQGLMLICQIVRMTY